MKTLMLVSLIALSACNQKPMEDPAKTVINPQAAQGQDYPANDSDNENAEGFVEENSLCICTKEYDPVCANGQTFPSPCQAKCEGVTDFTKGACS
jgi:hypothetical protein